MTRPGARRGAVAAVATATAALLVVACEPATDTGAPPFPVLDARDGVEDDPSGTSALATGPAGTTDPAPPADAVPATVERVVDGDTVVVRVDGDRERVRLLRIDTPEVARDGDPGECLAAEATAALESLLPVDEPVLLATDVEARDRYDRLLAHVWTAGAWVNGEMLRRGVAQVVTFPPNTAFDVEVLTAQRDARDAQVGLWAPGSCP